METNTHNILVTNERSVSPLFLYLKTCRLGERELKKLREAGYVPIAVESFDAVKIAEPIVIGDAAMIAKAAFATLDEYPSESMRANFGAKVANLLKD